MNEKFIELRIIRRLIYINVHILLFGKSREILRLLHCQDDKDINCFYIRMKLYYCAMKFCTLLNIMRNS